MNKNKIVELYAGDGNIGNKAESNPYDDAMAKSLREENYKSFYNNAIQAYNYENNAKKYLANELASQGLENSGYGTSAHVGINAQAQNMYARAQDEYNKGEEAITLENQNRIDEANAQKTVNVVSQLEMAGTNAEKRAILKAYGYLDDSGNIREDLDEDTKTVLNVANGLNIQYQDANEMLDNVTYTNSSGENKTLRDNYNAEINDLIGRGLINVNEAVSITNGQGETIYVIRTADGYSLISKEAYDKFGGNKHTLTREGKKKKHYNSFDGKK